MITSVTNNYTDLLDPTAVNGYKLVLDNGEIWSVPLNPTNRHYQEIQAWVADGNTIAEPA